MLQQKEAELTERIKARANEVLKSIEDDVGSRLQLISTELEKQTARTRRIDSMMAGLDLNLNLNLNLDTKLQTNPKGEQQIRRDLQRLEELLTEHHRQFKEESAATSNNPYAVQDFPSSFVTLPEPDLGLELIDKRRKPSEADHGRNAGLPPNPSQFTEKDPLVKFKDTYSTCDNRTVGNNLELTTQGNPNEQELLSSKQRLDCAIRSPQCDKRLSVLWGPAEGNSWRGRGAGAIDQGKRIRTLQTAIQDA